MTFSRPESIGLKPTPRARSVDARPHTSICPEVGGRIPAIARMIVDLPAPLAPMIPSAVPFGTSKETLLTALTSMRARSPRPARTMAFLKVGTRSKVVR